MQHSIVAVRSPNEQVDWSCSCQETGSFHAPRWDVDTWTAPWMLHLQADAEFNGVNVTWTR